MALRVLEDFYGQIARPRAYRDQGDQAAGLRAQHCKIVRCAIHDEQHVAAGS